MTKSAITKMVAYANALLLSIASCFLQLIATALANFTRPIAIICLATRIDIITSECICLAVTELATVNDADFDHGYHILS